jgi:hypothetical protein
MSAFVGHTNKSHVQLLYNVRYVEHDANVEKMRGDSPLEMPGMGKTGFSRFLPRGPFRGSPWLVVGVGVSVVGIRF